MSTERPELADVLARAADPDAFDAWQQRAKTTGWCRNPIRLVGAAQRIDTTTGQIVGRFTSTELPDRVLLKACGHRRATRCPTCSATYQADAYQLVAAGLQGGKGVPDTIATHPMVFVTLTAPSFGPVHTSHHTDTGLTSPCHPDSGTCPHRRARSCPALHQPDDPLLGQPICPDCFDYPKAVLWNAHAGELWRRTTIATQRSMATLAGIPRSQLRQQVRISFSKVVEYQRRGSVHIHAVIRLDGATDSTDPPPATFESALLTAAISKAIVSAFVPWPSTRGVSRPLGWGPQSDIRTIGSREAVPRAVAGYLAKYATKSTDPSGLLDRRLTSSELDRLEDLLSPHLARMVRTAWDLGRRPELEHLRLRAWAHTLGFRGHWLTKSRAYSTTFAALRTARHHWNLARNANQSPDVTTTMGEWHYTGRGWTTQGDAWLAETAARHQVEHRRTARLEHRGANPTPHDDAPH